MMEIVPFVPEHLQSLKLQTPQSELQECISVPGYGKDLVNRYTYSAVIDGTVAGICGIIPIWKGRAMAWALLTEAFDKRHFVKAHMKVRNVLDNCHLDGFARIEATVDVDFEQGHRWVKALGFRSEGGIAARFSPEGRNHVRYERIAA